jgi:hypothetical protein
MDPKKRGLLSLSDHQIELTLNRLNLMEYHNDLLALKYMKWEGPITINHLLDCGISGSDVWPPDANGVYFISEKPWTRIPGDDSVPLYVGSNTGKSLRFRTRIGDVIADAFGLFVKGSTGHSSGGQSIFYHCVDNQLSPKDIYIGWVRECGCVRCAENYVYDWLDPHLNKNRPPRCTIHPYASQALAAFNA